MAKRDIADRPELNARLVELREAAKLSQAAVAGALEWSESKVVRIEGDKSGVSTVDLKAMLALYGVTDKAEINHLCDLARARRARR
jgi:transcriptional regulator with XRE-family HTH domain